MRIEDYVQSPVFQKHVVQFASVLLKRFKHPPLELADLVQDATSAALEKAPKHNPALATMETFAKRTAEWAVQEKIRHAIRRKRDHRVCITLSTGADVTDEGGEEGNSSGKGAPFIASVDDAAREVDRRLDIQAVLQKLDPESKALCLRLMNEKPDEIAKADGVHRSTVYRRVDRIRAVFEQAGLQDYL